MRNPAVFYQVMFALPHFAMQVCSNYELGQRDIPTDVLIRLSRFSQVSTDYLLGLTNNPKQNK